MYSTLLNCNSRNHIKQTTFPQKTYKRPFHSHSQAVSHKWQVNTIIQRNYVSFKQMGIVPIIKRLRIKSSLHPSLWWFTRAVHKKHKNNYQVIRNILKGTLKYFLHKIGRKRWDRGSKNKGLDVNQAIYRQFLLSMPACGSFAANSFLCLSCDLLIAGSSKIQGCHPKARAK